MVMGLKFREQARLNAYSNLRHFQGLECLGGILRAPSKSILPMSKYSGPCWERVISEYLVALLALKYFVNLIYTVSLGWRACE